jgi:membrane protease YdiL (CAAX protease family)
VSTVARVSSSEPVRVIVTVGAIAAGTLVLTLRVPGTISALMFTALAGAIGAMGAVIGAPATKGSLRWRTVVLIGCAAFLCARAIGTAHPGPIWWPAVAVSVVAAVAEEAFFRRLVYGALAPFGPAVAILGAAALFAAVHVPVYGAGVLLIDVAAGIVLGWQRWASGGWSAPAVTHIVANLVGLGW